jgi:hypothetical protein
MGQPPNRLEVRSGGRKPPVQRSLAESVFGIRARPFPRCADGAFKQWPFNFIDNRIRRSASFFRAENLCKIKEMKIAARVPNSVVSASHQDFEPHTADEFAAIPVSACRSRQVAHCLWCGRMFTTRVTGGLAQKFCSTEHQRHFGRRRVAGRCGRSRRASYRSIA